MKTESAFERPLSGIVQDVRSMLLDRLPDDICLLILYGSEARGEAKSDSDVDLIVVLRSDNPRLKIAVQDAVYDVMWQRDFDRMISVYVLPADRFEAQRRRGFSFIRNVEREGVVLWQAA
jgi:uncharacterized protein